MSGLFIMAFDAMRSAPLSLSATMSALAPLQGVIEVPDDTFISKTIGASVVGDYLHTKLIRCLVDWDAQEGVEWVGDTERNTVERRVLIYKLLAVDKYARAALEAISRVAIAPDPVVVSANHSEWYVAPRKQDRFYWESYRDHLLNQKHWEGSNVALLDRSTDRVMEGLSDPSHRNPYSCRGLVVGHVQSGKTANFTGVIAKAIDSGYRLIIVLSGTLDLLRDQTQRRLDMELVGQEQLRASAGECEPTDYDLDPDWIGGRFIQHGGLPSTLGSVDIDRLTPSKGDYQSVSTAIRALHFERRRSDVRLNDPENLAYIPVRLLVMKKNNTVLARLIGDLKRITGIADVPALIIDDESDQASINTARPNASEKKRRTAINLKIVTLLGMLGRGQYVGYTATPFANVFIDPEDAQDLFPRDFIVSLQRPEGYMGVSNFHDLEPRSDEEEAAQTVGNSNELAFVRGLYSPLDASDADLQRALDSYLLTGAIKLLRRDEGVVGDWTHHTMLVHESSRQEDHMDLAKRVDNMWRSSGYRTSAANVRLRQILDDDLRPVSALRDGGLPFPADFKVLAPYLGRALDLIEDDDKPLLIVNGDKDNAEDTPDFDLRPIWRIIVGGTKLSRGYTIEGLTISYYRRRASSGSTLMQMGRWFGFRPGYGDLVRLFIGRHEPVNPNGTRFVDLYEGFEAVCRDEEAFRRQLSRYAPADEGGEAMRPMDVAPLVANHADWLPPVARNKRYNAVLRTANFGGQWIERTVVSDDDDDLRDNKNLLERLLKGRLSDLHLGGEVDGRSFSYSAFCGKLTNDETLELLDGYAWGDVASNAPKPLLLEREYIKGVYIDPEVDDWVVVIPKLKNPNPALGDIRIAGKDIHCVERSRTELTRRYKVFSTPRDRIVAEAIAGVGDLVPNKVIDDLCTPRRGVVLLYAVYDKDNVRLGLPVMGLSILPPFNSSKKVRSFSVLREDERNAPVISMD